MPRFCDDQWKWLKPEVPPLFFLVGVMNIYHLCFCSPTGGWTPVITRRYQDTAGDVPARLEDVSVQFGRSFSLKVDDHHKLYICIYIYIYGRISKWWRSNWMNWIQDPWEAVDVFPMSHDLQCLNHPTIGARFYPSSPWKVNLPSGEGDIFMKFSAFERGTLLRIIDHHGPFTIHKEWRTFLANSPLGVSIFEVSKTDFFVIRCTQDCCWSNLGPDGWLWKIYTPQAKGNIENQAFFLRVPFQARLPDYFKLDNGSLLQGHGVIWRPGEEFRIPI